MCHTGCNGPAIGQQQQQQQPQQRQQDGDCCRQRRRWWWRGAAASPSSRDRGEPHKDQTSTTTSTTAAPPTIAVVDITSNRSSTTCTSIPSPTQQQKHQQQQHRHYHLPTPSVTSSPSSSSSSRANSDRINSLSHRNIITSTARNSKEAHISPVIAEQAGSCSSLDKGDHHLGPTLCTCNSSCDYCCRTRGFGVTLPPGLSSYNSVNKPVTLPVPTSLVTSLSSCYNITGRSLLRLSLQQCVFTVLLLCLASFSPVAECCSSRSTPKPRPPSPTSRPNVTFLTYACPPAYAAWYCLNGATCFTVKIEDSILYNCECADGYMGQRCEFKDLDGSYLPAREKVLLETASIAGGATVATVLVFVVLAALYVIKQRDKEKRDLDETSDRRPFSGYQSTLPETFHTISNPYARTAELSHVEVVVSSVNTGAAVSSSASCSSLHSPS